MTSRPLARTNSAAGPCRLQSYAFGHMDVEGEHGGREPGEDDEPSLCGCAEMAGAGGDDREGERKDEEPALGWPERISQVRLW
jgi:hypothetical protein